MSDPVETRLLPGTMVGAYRVEGELGRGGMSTVYAAEEPTIRKRVAIKVLRRSLAEDPAMALRFEREARAVNEIRHPGIIDVFAVGRLPDGRPYLVMSLLEGCSLRDEIAARGGLPLREAWRLARAVADALGAAHDAGIVHRDLKPDNVFLERFGPDAPPRPRLLDFGIAKKVEPDDAEAMKLTATGVPLGTPAYMAPEQWWGAAVTAQTDQYALGAVLFEMLVGRPPFTSRSFAELVHEHVHEPPPTLARAGVTAPAGVEALVARLLAKSPDDRFDAMRAVIEAGDLAFDAPPQASEGGALPPAPVAFGAALPPAKAEAEALPEAAREAPARPVPVPPLPGARALARYLRLHAAVLLLGYAALVAVGYAGYARHDAREWMRLGGSGQYAVIASIPVGAYALTRLARRRAATGTASRAGFWIALLPAFFGAFTTYTGWTVILRFIGDVAELKRLTIFAEGTYEANSARFLGFGVATVFCLSLAALPGVSGMARATSTLSGAPGMRRGEALAAAAVLVLIAVTAALVGAPSGALIAGACAVALGLGVALPTVHAETAARDELERAAASVLAVALATAVGITRLEAREAALWVEQATRASRVAEIVAAQYERDATVFIAAASLAVLAVIEGLRIRRLAVLGAVGRPGAGTAVLIGVVALAAAGDLLQHGRFIGKRDELRGDLAAQFALIARLDPPPGDALDPQRFPPHRATALQITRDVVAVDGRGVARLRALDAPEGATHVASDLNHALAQAGLAQTDTAPLDLSVSIDRQVKGDTLLRLLRVARAAGVRRIEILLTRGESPRVPPRAPPETAIVMPGDFVALPVELGDDGVELPAGEAFGAIAPALIARALAEEGPVRIAVR